MVVERHMVMSFSLDEWHMIMLCINDDMGEPDPKGAGWDGPMLKAIRDKIKLRLEKEEANEQR